METYGVTITKAQIYIFAFLFSRAFGTILGGPLSDRFGKNIVILIVLIINSPFTLLLPFVNSVLACILLILIGVCLMSSFSVSVVYAQVLIPGKVGTMSGLTVGLAFGMGAIGSVVFGSLIDYAGLFPTMVLISF